MNVERLTLLYRAHLATTRRRTERVVLRTFDQLTGIDDATAEQFADRAAVTMSAAQSAFTRQTLAYFRLVAQAETGTAVAHPQIAGGVIGSRVPVIGAHLEQTATPLQRVYIRPFFRLWQDLHKGRALQDALRAARTVIARNVATDLTMVARNTAQMAIAADPRIVGWRRVAGEGEAACGLCSEALQHTYHRDAPMQIHVGDTCFARPVFTTDAPLLQTSATESPEFGHLFQERAHA